MKHENFYEYIDLEFLGVQDEGRKLHDYLFGNINFRIGKPLLTIYNYDKTCKKITYR